MPNIQLNKFNMAELKDDKVVVFIGKRETGKSFLVRDLLYHHQDIPVGTVISGTEGANSFYASMMPPIFIHNEFNPTIVANYLRRQKKVVKATHDEGNNVDPRAFFILDDCLYDQTWVKDKAIRSMFMNGRHYKSLFLITMQYALGIPPNLRTNIDYVFLLRENINSNRKRLYEQYAGMFGSFEIFSQVMDQCTENFECIVINNNAKSNKLEDQVFWYKADAHEDFKIGHPSFWKFHNDNFNPEYEESDDFSNKKNKKIVVNVKKLRN
tara:strand:+ start:504 stop:1307 length:804 start_codon:yes stop_codon:yes gene_type:complete